MNKLLVSLFLVPSFAFAQNTPPPFSPVAQSVLISAPSGSSSASTGLPGAGAGAVLQVYDAGTVPIAWVSSNLPGGATATATSNVVSPGGTAYFFVGTGVFDVAAYGIGGSASVYFQLGNGGYTANTNQSYPLISGSFVLNDCFKVGTVSPLTMVDSGGTCGSGGGGGLSSVGLSTTASWFTIGNSPLTVNGVITMNPTTGLTANEFLATPNGTTGAVGLRAIVAADIPPLPLSQITGLGTGVVTALGVNVGSAGAVVTNGGALGTPSSGVATNLTGTATALNIGGTAANLSGTPALPNGVTATTQTTGDNSTKLATDAFVIANASSSGVSSAAAGGGIVISGTGSGPYTGAITIGTTVPNRTVTTSPTVLSTDMGGALVMNVSGGGTLTIPAIGSGVFGAGQSLFVVNYSASTVAVSTTPTVNAGGGCITATGIPTGDTWQLFSNGTSLDCVQTVSSGGGSGTVTDGSGTTTANELLSSTTTAHQYSVVATLPTAAMPALTGDVTSTTGSIATTVAKVNGVTVGSTTLTSGTTITPNCSYMTNYIVASATGALTVAAPTGCTPYDGQKLLLKVKIATGGNTYSASAIIAGANLAWPSTAGTAGDEDHFVLIYDATLTTPGWVLEAYNPSVP